MEAQRSSTDSEEGLPPLDLVAAAAASAVDSSADLDFIELNVGGKVFATRRSTVCAAGGPLEAIV